MGGMAFEALARQGYFAAVLDLSLCELGNLMVGSVINSGEDRLRGAGAAGNNRTTRHGRSLGMYAPPHFGHEGHTNRRLGQVVDLQRS